MISGAWPEWLGWSCSSLSIFLPCFLQISWGMEQCFRQSCFHGISFRFFLGFQITCTDDWMRSSSWGNHGSALIFRFIRISKIFNSMFCCPSAQDYESQQDSALIPILAYRDRYAPPGPLGSLERTGTLHMQEKPSIEITSHIVGNYRIWVCTKENTE